VARAVEEKTTKTDIGTIGRYPSMAVAVAKVPANAKVGWNILLMVLRIEWVDMKPEFERIAEDLRVLHEETLSMIRSIEDIQAKLDPIFERTMELKNDVTPLWEDNYNLCGDPRCAGDCTVCLQGEEDYEEDYEEKYCRRGRR
jgi:hypothetical protein